MDNRSTIKKNTTEVKMDFSAVLDISKTVSITDTNNNNISDVGDVAIYTLSLIHI